MSLNGSTRAQVNTIKTISAEITAPAELTAALADLDKIEANRAALTAAERQAATDAHQAALSGKLTLDLAAKTSTASAVTPILNAAEEEAARNVLAINRENADPITKSIRDTIYTPALEALKTIAAQTSTGDTPESLIRAGRQEDATALVQANDHYETLTKAQTYRRNYSTTATQRHPQAQWKNPQDVTGKLAHSSLRPNPAYRFLDALRAGGDAWMPTNAELEAIS